MRITWNPATDTFTWGNRAGVKWSLTPIPKGEDDWDTTRLKVGAECPYFKDGHEFAGVEWEGDPGYSAVKIISGPWDEAYLRQESCGSGRRVAEVSADDKLVVMNKARNMRNGCMARNLLSQKAVFYLVLCLVLLS